MKPPAFHLIRPSILSEAIEAGSSMENAEFLAGGQSVMVALNMQRRAPTALVDLSGIEELRTVTVARDSVLIGAMVTQAELIRNEELRKTVPLLALAASWVGHPQVRSRGTLGGSLALAHPAAELPAAAVALNVTLVLEGPNGRREVRAADFFSERTKLGTERGEVLVHSLWPVAARTRNVSVQEMRRGHGAPSALAGVTAMRENGAELTVSVFGATRTPTKLRALESAYRPDMLAADTEELVWRVVDQLPNIVDDSVAPSSYRARVLKSLLIKSLRELESQRPAPRFPRVSASEMVS